MRFTGAVPQAPTISGGTVPAPVGGINSLTSLAGMEPTDAIYTKNIDATTYGLKVRPGYQEWANGYSGDQVKTIIPYEGTAEDGSEDKLFAVTSVAIYDITNSTTTPTAVHTWGISGTDAGWCSYEVFTNDAGARILMVCDLANGYRIYTESTGLWTTPSITGPTGGAADLIFLVSFKNRVWFIEKDTNAAWYTDIGVFQGTVTKFNFGNKFAHGGFLKTLHNWTLDSGVGPDDYLVATSSAGDVLVYAGTNPSSASTFGQIGNFFVGKFPAGRRIGLSVGGDLYLLSSYGIISAKDLLTGKNPFTAEGSVSYKVNRVLNAAIQETITDYGWGLELLPDLARIIITSPKINNRSWRQFVYEINLKAWSEWSDVPMTTIVTHDNELYIGANLRVYKLTGTVDNALLAAPDPQPIYWSLLTAYNELGSPQMNKVVEFMRARFIAEAEPSYNMKALYDYDLSTLITALSAQIGEDVWDTGTWDNAIWGGGQDSFQDLIGGSGMGKTVAIAMAGASTTDTTLIDIGVMYRTANSPRGYL